MGAALDFRFRIGTRATVLVGRSHKWRGLGIVAPTTFEFGNFFYATRKR